MREIIQTSVLGKSQNSSYVPMRFPSFSYPEEKVCVYEPHPHVTFIACYIYNLLQLLCVYISIYLSIFK